MYSGSPRGWLRTQQVTNKQCKWHTPNHKNTDWWHKCTTSRHHNECTVHLNVSDNCAVLYLRDTCRTLRWDARQMTVNVITFACSFNVWSITSSQAEVTWVLLTLVRSACQPLGFVWFDTHIIVYPRINIYVHHLCTMHYAIQLHTHNTSIANKLHWNFSITDTLDHLSNEDTLCCPNHIEVCTHLPLN